MKVNTKDNYWIEGMDNFELGYLVGKNKILYQGKTSEIPEEIAEKVAVIDERVSYWEGDDDVFYIDYSDINLPRSDPRSSVKSALTKQDGSISEYCIIWEG